MTDEKKTKTPLPPPPSAEPFNRLAVSKRDDRVVVANSAALLAGLTREDLRSLVAWSIVVGDLSIDEIAIDVADIRKG